MFFFTNEARVRQFNLSVSGVVIARFKDCLLQNVKYLILINGFDYDIWHCKCTACHVKCHKTLITLPLLARHNTCNYVSADGGKGWPVVACPSRALVVIYLMLTLFACYVLTYVWDAVYIFNHLPMMVFVHGLCFSNSVLNKLPWTSYLYAIPRIISRGVSGLATDSPCGVWGRGWTTCLLHDSPLFGSHFKMRVGM